MAAKKKPAFQILRAFSHGEGTYAPGDEDRMGKEVKPEMQTKMFALGYLARVKADEPEAKD